MWTACRELKEEYREEIKAVDFDVKDMLIWQISNTFIDYNRGFNMLWDTGWSDSKDKKYYVFNEPINKPTFINVAFILEKIYLEIIVGSLIRKKFIQL